jgi:SAM-dependent methyltransferase
MVESLGIRTADRVLDVGGGSHPFPRADVITDLFFNDPSHRDGQPITLLTGKRHIVCHGEALPFLDKSFDFVYCSHTLEHTADPARACAELIRVGKRGYIETPRKMTDMFAGYPSHRWLVECIEGELIFDRRTFIESPFQNFALAYALANPEILRRGEVAYRNVTCVQFAWERGFRFRVRDVQTEGAFDYSNPRHAGYSHFYFALNLLRHGAPAAHALFHAVKAVGLIPDEPQAWSLLGLYRLLNRDLPGAEAALVAAGERAPSDEVVSHNLRIVVGLRSGQSSQAPPRLPFSGEAVPNRA